MHFRLLPTSYPRKVRVTGLENIDFDYDSPNQLQLIVATICNDFWVYLLPYYMT